METEAPLAAGSAIEIRNARSGRFVTREDNTVRILRESIMENSNQSWKLVVGFIGMFCGFFVMCFGLQRLEQPNAAAIVFTGIVAGLGAAIAACLSIRCPSCHARWLWLAVRSQDHLRWVSWLSAQRVCPRCGYDPALKSEPEMGEPPDAGTD